MEQYHILTQPQAALLKTLSAISLTNPQRLS